MVSALPPLIQAMLQPQFYPHPVVGSIEVIQTHISYIVLTGDYAYKVKKPMNFGFLDFTTLEKREHFCREELRLNQRGAAELYLEVLPITELEGTYTLNGSLTGTGSIVDFALKMKQFPQETLLNRMFDRGELTEPLMQELGRIVAHYHSRTETSEYIRTFGTVERVREAFDENYEQTEHYIGGPQTQAQFEQTQSYTDHFFASQKALFETRIQQDRIRECHGDLHLGNICAWQNKILLFDCIEFNEPFRFVDVMFDVAYAVMDLDLAQRSDLGNAYLNAYLEQTGDWEGLQVLPIYLNRQTYVRAKVNSFLLDDPNAPADLKDKASHTAARYYHLAWQYTQPRQGQLLAMAGLSGSGKSTVARHLARRLNAIHIRADAVRKHLGGIPLQERGGADLYSPEMTAKTYSRLLHLGLTLAQCGYRVILDAKYDRHSLRNSVIEATQGAEIPLHFIHCFAPVETIHQRLQDRSGDIADATSDLLPQQLAQWEPFTPQEESLLLPLDTTLDWQQALQTFLLDPSH